MSQSPLFSSGSELGNLAVTSGVLSDSWDVISALYREINNVSSSDFPVIFKIDDKRPNCNIIAFVTWPPCTKEHLQAIGASDVVSSSALKDTLPLFEFLCSKTNPCFSINKLAVECFKSIRGVLPFLRSQISDSKPLIISGHGLGGSVASLFTLWLLSEINLSKTKRPLCVTFGSPLIGDEDLKEAILQYSVWNSCFLHVVSAQDPLPRVLTSTLNPPSTESASRTNEYKPFGTFMLCSELGFTCFEDPELILVFLTATYSEVSPQFLDYKPVVEQLKLKVICKDTSWLDVSISQPLREGNTVQVLATGLGQQQPWQNIDINDLIAKAEKRKFSLMRQVFDPSMELNDIKINMAQLEWYKKTSKDSGIGYYDSYKNQSFTSDQDVEKYKKTLTCYWQRLVDEVDKKPQKEGASFRTRWLFGGTNYRRMIEPLDIAAFYRDGHTDYLQERPKHYKLLEQWLNDDARPASNRNINSKKKNVEANLTEDSCFWAHVEEARISCKLMLIRNSESSIVDLEGPHKSNLIAFEGYVWGLLRNYAISPEIFLTKSSFMGWWKEYEEIIAKGIMGTSHSSPLAELMKTRRYSHYATGSLEFPEICMQ
ncbi:senescence-associated carboxylesterase 101 isoform X2 [Juglans microcarpa x Juglans regia]|uniref:senescence-associated carboxylesterase 101 isoform X2 n=1 Tax=Juglans microcarpa x Juglans regia TaxID=2249226 RepID=UPI001B7EFB86|nr:senescence-associated carboxylesterase 101 isoform X2 [Juglans microcarpa x Juglans regia]